jgi:uncharacterized membrane protein YfhO
MALWQRVSFFDVTCASDTGGLLVVTENPFSGWKAKIDGKPARLVLHDNWLALNVPAGNHTYQFRYRPWDVPVGMLLTLCGLGLIVWLLFFRRENEAMAVG